MSGDDLWKRDEIQSPCVRVCVIHPTEKICAGCFRTVDEITQWSRLSHEARAALIEELPARAPRLKRRRGGRKARQSR